MKTRTITPIIAVMAASLLLWACGTEQPEDSITAAQDALEQNNGGYDLTDEAPAFGSANLDGSPVDVSHMTVPEEPGVDAFTGVAPGQSMATLPCRHGYLKGVWRPFVAGRPFGMFMGKWVTANGKVDGYLKGIYGRNLMGNGVLFGKYIDPQGKARGLLRGQYGNGYFRARWHDISGIRGALRGVYAKGTFRGLWRAFCKPCKLLCKPGFKAAGPGKCFCVPAKVVPCRKGQCPTGMFCNPCPRPAKCKAAGVKCPAVCAPPVCMKRPLPPKKGHAPSQGHGADLK